VDLKIHLSGSTRKDLVERLRYAYRTGQLRIIRRIQVVMLLAAGQTVREVAELLGRGEQTVRDYLAAFLLRGVESVAYRRPRGRPAKLTKTQCEELAVAITAGPVAAGYATGCWSALLIADWILQHFGVEYHPQYLCQLLDTLGFSFQKAKFISDHLNEETRQVWMEETWPTILQRAQKTGALILFGDEASFAQWGSLSYTWAPKGKQPTVQTSGKRKGYKVFGLIDYCSGRLFFQGQTERFTTESYRAFLEEVLAQTTQPILLIQDGAKYHTSKGMQQFFDDHAERLTRFQLPAYSPDFNPIEKLWKKVKKRATHLKYFSEFAGLMEKVDEALRYFAQTPREIIALMGCCRESAPAAAA
jgi:transposase